MFVDLALGKSLIHYEYLSTSYLSGEYIQFLRFEGISRRGKQQASIMNYEFLTYLSTILIPTWFTSETWDPGVVDIVN